MCRILFLAVVFVHIASGPAALLLLLLLGFSNHPWGKKNHEMEAAAFQQEEVQGVCCFMEQMWVSPLPAGSRGHLLLPRAPLTGSEMSCCSTGGQCSPGSKLIHLEHHC